MADYKKQLTELIMTIVKEGASDLHLSVGRHPTIRVFGSLIPLVKDSALSPEDTEGLVFSMLDEKEKEELLKIGRAKV